MPDLILAYLRNAALFAPAIAFMLFMRALPGGGDAHWRHAALAGALLALRTPRGCCAGGRCTAPRSA